MKSEATPESAAAPASGAGGEAERLSAWLDGELDAQEAEALVGSLVRQPAWRRQYEDWCMVGDALRSNEVAAQHSPRLCARISKALQGEPALLAPRALSTSMKRHLASGAAVAAAMMVLVFVAVPQLRGTGTGTGAGALVVNVNPASSNVQTVTSAVGSNEPGSVAIAAGSGEIRPARDPRLDPYFQAHRDFTGAGVMPAAAVYLRSSNEGDR
jgi:sigma-E factor negative regulatory protein RseA